MESIGTNRKRTSRGGSELVRRLRPAVLMLKWGDMMVEIIHKLMWPVVWLIMVAIMIIGIGAVLFFIWGIIFIVIMGG